MNNTDMSKDRLINFYKNRFFEDIKQNNTEKVQERIKRGFHLAMCDEETGETGLHIASKHNYLEMVKLLLPVADSSVRNNDGKTAEDCATTLEMRQLFEDDRKTAANLDSDRFKTVFAYQDPVNIAYCNAPPLPLHHGPVSQIKRSDIENTIKKPLVNKIQVDKGNFFFYSGVNKQVSDSTQQKMWKEIFPRIQACQPKLGLLKMGKDYIPFTSDGIKKHMPLGFIAGEWGVHPTDDLVSNMLFSMPISPGYSAGVSTKKFTNIINYLGYFPSQEQLDKSYEFHDEAIKSQVALANIVEKDQHIAVPVFYTTCNIDAFQLLGVHFKDVTDVDFRLFTKRGEAISPDAYDRKYIHVELKQHRIDMVTFIESYPREIIKVLASTPFMDALEKDTKLTEISACFDPIRLLSRNKIKKTSRQSKDGSKYRCQKLPEVINKIVSYAKELGKFFLDNQELVKGAFNSLGSLWKDDFKKAENWETAFVVLGSVLTRQWIEAEKKGFAMEVQKVTKLETLEIVMSLVDYKQISKQLAEKFTREELKHWFPEVLHHIDRDTHNLISDNVCASDIEGDQAPTSEAVDALSKAVKDCDILKVTSNQAAQTTILDHVPCPSQENKAPLKRIKAFDIDVKYIQSDIKALVEASPAKERRELLNTMALHSSRKVDRDLDFSSEEVVGQGKKWLQETKTALDKEIKSSREKIKRGFEALFKLVVKGASQAVPKLYPEWKKVYDLLKNKEKKYRLVDELIAHVYGPVARIDPIFSDALCEVCLPVLKKKFRDSTNLPRKSYEITLDEAEESIRGKKPKFITTRDGKKIVLSQIEKKLVCSALRWILDDEQIKAYFSEDIQESILKASRRIYPPNAKNSIQYVRPKDWKVKIELIPEDEILYSQGWPKSREHCELKTVDEIGRITKRQWVDNILFHPTYTQIEEQTSPVSASRLLDKSTIDKVKTTRSNLVLVHLKPTKKRAANALTPEFCVMTLEKIHKGDTVDCISGALNNLPPATGNKFLFLRSSAAKKAASDLLDFTDFGNITSCISYLPDSSRLDQDYCFLEEKDKNKIATSNLKVNCDFENLPPTLRATRDILPGSLLGFDNEYSKNLILLDKQGIPIKPDKYIPKNFYVTLNGYFLSLVDAIEVHPEIIFPMFENTKFIKQAQTSGIVLPKENRTQDEQILLEEHQRQESYDKLCEQIKKQAKPWAVFLKDNAKTYAKEFDNACTNLYSALEKKDKPSMIRVTHFSLEEASKRLNQDARFNWIERDKLCLSKLEIAKLKSEMKAAFPRPYGSYFFGEQMENKLSRDDQPSSKKACKPRH